VSTAHTIVYLHGFRSSPASAKATRLAAAVAALPPASRPRLIVPALPDRPARAMEAIDALASHAHEKSGSEMDFRRYGGGRGSNRPEIHLRPRFLSFIGSSLGGYYATVAAERHGARAVLVNPTVRPDEDLRAHAGVQVNLHTGAAFEVTTAHFDELRAMRVARISQPERYFLLVETGDELLDYRQAVAFYAGAYQLLRGGGNHAFVGFETQVPAILRFCGVG
jgi:predicted esterase YcpF (UPF0227 family)